MPFIYKIKKEEACRRRRVEVLKEEEDTNTSLSLIRKMKYMGNA